jgi:hypothetical protein
MTNPTNENSLQSWATGKLAMFTIGLLAGIALYNFGVIQKITSKLFSKKEAE